MRSHNDENFHFRDLPPGKLSQVILEFSRNLSKLKPGEYLSCFSYVQGDEETAAG